MVQRDRLYVDDAGGSGSEFCDGRAESYRRGPGLPESADRSYVSYADEASRYCECPGYRQLRSRAGGREAATSGRLQESEVSS